MRVIHLCFQLHSPLDGRDLKGKTDPGKLFAEADKEIYQPFFALLERNVQKHAKLKVSLMISGLWLEMAEKYNRDLIERLRKLVQQERVELIAEPYYHSLAFFYDQAELTEQVKLQQDKLEQLFAQKSRVFAMPEMIYNDRIGEWAEGYGFVGMLVGGSSRALDWRSPNHVYDAIDCKYLRLLFRNSRLSDLVSYGESDILVEKTEKDEKKSVVSIDKFQKQLELATLRGNLINLYFDTEIFQRRRAEGIIGFFDELFSRWLGISGNNFVGAAQACVVETPNVAISIPATVSSRDDRTDDGRRSAGRAVVIASDDIVPDFLGSDAQVKMSQKLYTLGRAVLASEDDSLIDEFRRLTAMDYALAMTAERVNAWDDALADLRRRVDEVKKSKILEISKSFEKRRDEIEVKRVKKGEPVAKPLRPEVKRPRPVVKSPEETGTQVMVHFGKHAAGTESHKVHVVTELSQSDVPVHRLMPKKAENNASVEVNSGNQEEAEAKKPKKILRKVIRKLVIE